MMYSVDPSLTAIFSSNTMAEIGLNERRNKRKLSLDAKDENTTVNSQRTPTTPGTVACALAFVERRDGREQTPRTRATSQWLAQLDQSEFNV